MPEGNFDFQKLTEQPENLDSVGMISCPHCSKSISLEATMCLYCGQEVYRRGKPMWIILTTCFLIISFIVFLILAI